jgi:hypothetical protein
MKKNVHPKLIIWGIEIPPGKIIITSNLLFPKNKIKNTSCLG